MKFFVCFLALVAAAIAAAVAVPAVVEASIMPAQDPGLYGFIYFNLQVTEYCDGSPGNPLMADAIWTDEIGTSIPFSFGYATDHESINIGYPNQLEISYDYYTAKASFRFDNCVWNEDMASTLCGACANDPWSQGSPLNCVTNPWISRSHTLYCRVLVEYRDSALGGSKPLGARDNITAVQATVVAAATRTTTIVPEVIATLPASNQGTSSETWILPFHITLSEYCENGNKIVKAHYHTNADVADLMMWPGVYYSVQHRVPGFPRFDIGTYDYEKSRLRFHYSNGPLTWEWYDDEAWKYGGECRAGLWSGPSFDCTAGESRVKEMDCSFILGETKQLVPR